MRAISIEFLTLSAKILLVLLPGIVFPAIYLAYRRSLAYRKGDIERLANSVAAIRQEPDKRQQEYVETSEQLKTQLLSELDDLYNWKNYAVPLAMSCITTWIAAFAALSKVKLPLGITEIQNPLFGQVPAVVLAGIAGAYVANLIDLTEHARVRNLTSSYFQITWVRLISGAVLGYIAGRVFSDNLAILAAFGVGLAPLKEGVEWIMQKVRDAWGQQPKALRQSEEPTLHHLQGLTEEVLNTLSEQRITSTEQLAYASPARLLARTDLEWIVILDVIDQALLFNYVGENIKQFRILGIRGSIEMGTLYEELSLQGVDPGVQARRAEAEATLHHLAAVVSGMDMDSLKHTICTLYEDLTVRRLAHLFGSGLGKREQPVWWLAKEEVRSKTRV